MEWKDIMQVNRVDSVYNVNFSKRHSAEKKNDAPVYYVKNEDVLKFGLTGLAIIGAASIAKSILKKYNQSPADIIKDTVSNISKKFAAHPKEDPVIRILDGNRDIDAVKMYRKYQSQAKIKSFSDKFLAGEFNDKPGKVLTYMSKNLDKLNRVASRVI